MSAGIGIGVDVGGSFTKIAAVNASGKVLRELEIPTRPEQAPREFVRRVGSLVHLLESELGEVGGVGLALAGDVDSERGSLRFAPNLKRWSRFNFKAAFSRALQRAVVVDNDANMGVWGAYVMELKGRPRSVVGIALGTGVGGGLILDGRLYRGATGSAGEIGHAKVLPGGALCHCGGRGCLEAYAGSYGIARTARRLTGKRGAALDPQALAAAARRGDRAARRVWEETGAHLAVAIETMILVYNPDVVLILGGVSRAGGLLLSPIKRALARQPFKTPFQRASVRIAKRHNWGSVGAALLALDARR